MKQKIKEVQEYFKQKILSGDYQLLSNENLTATIIIDNKYSFYFFIPKEIENIRQWEHKPNFMNLPIFSKEDIFKLFHRLEVKINNYEIAFSNQKLLEQFEALKKEIERKGLISK